MMPTTDMAQYDFQMTKRKDIAFSIRLMLLALYFFAKTGYSSSDKTHPIECSECKGGGTISSGGFLGWCATTLSCPQCGGKDAVDRFPASATPPAEQDSPQPSDPILHSTHPQEEKNTAKPPVDSGDSNHPEEMKEDEQPSEMQPPSVDTSTEDENEDPNTTEPPVAAPVKKSQPETTPPQDEKTVEEWKDEILHWDDDRKSKKLLNSGNKNLYTLAVALLDDGVSVNIQDANGNTPLHRAAWKGHLRMAELFLSKECNKEASTNMGNKPLHRAAYNGHRKMVQLLLEAGANIEARCRYGHTAVFSAAHYGHVDTLKYLIERKADAKHKNDLGQSVLHVVAHKCLKKPEGIINILLAQGVDIEAGDNQGYSALHSSCYFGRRDTTEILLRLGADIEAKGTAGFTPLLSATLGAKPEIVRCLLHEGAYWDVVSNGPETITDVLTRAKTGDGAGADGKPSEEWLQCEKFLTNWLDSSYEELFFQHTFCCILSIPTDRCPKPLTGWLRSSAKKIRLPVSQTKALIAKVLRDSKFIADLHGPPQPRTTAEAACQYDLSHLSLAKRRRGPPRGDWKLVNGDYEWVESSESPDVPLVNRLLSAFAGAPSSTVAATQAGDN